MAEHKGALITDLTRQLSTAFQAACEQVVVQRCSDCSALNLLGLTA